MKSGIMLLAALTLGSQLMASQSFAGDRNCSEMGESVAKGAVVGGILGAIVGNNVGNRHVDGHDVATGAVLGGLTGAAIENERCRDERGQIVIYRDYRDGHRHGDWGRPDRFPAPPRELIIDRYRFDREFMDYYSRLRDNYEQSREIRNFADRLSRSGEKIDGRMLYDILSRIMERGGPRDFGMEREHALEDLQYATARLTSRERYDVEALFGRGPAAMRASRVLDRM